MRFKAFGSMVVIVLGLLGSMMLLAGPAAGWTTVGELSDEEVIDSGGDTCWFDDSTSEEVSPEGPDERATVGDQSIPCSIASSSGAGGDESDFLAKSDVLSESAALPKTGSNTTTAGAAFAFIGIGLLLHASSLKRQGA